MISNKMIKGLTTSEANKKLKEFGFNELPGSKPKNFWRIALEVMREPMFMLLVTCAILYIILGDVSEGTILLASISIIISITFIQYRKTEKALDALKKLSSPRALVIRDGVEIRIPGRDVVPDDIIIVNEGDRIPADLLLLESINLMVDESLLTGESLPVMKSIEKDNFHLYSGTLVVQGKGIAKVVTTGIHSQLGKIAVSLKSVKVEEETRLQKEMKVLIRRLGIIGIAISISVILLFYYTRGNFIQSLLNGLSASIAILPEEFPVVLTVFLALGAWRLSKQNVLTRKSSAIETLGAATVLCSDKTGTITQNKMEVVCLYNGEKVIPKNSFFDNNDTTSTLIKTVILASATNSVDPMEIAIRDLQRTLFSLNDVSHKLIKEYPLNKDLMVMTRVVKDVANNLELIAAKGAPENIFTLCQLSTAEIVIHTAELNKMAEKGYRVLGVAKATNSKNSLPETQSEFNFEFLGLVALEDPIRPEVPNAIKECHEAGVRIIMITGDYPSTAKSIAEQIGLSNTNVCTGEELNSWSNEKLKEEIKTISIFARVVPEQKLRIVKALKANREIVAMTGDGVNDAPALKAADIGVAMGNKGTDVAREASSLVLLDDNFASIVMAIRSGRRIFDNLQKAMSFILAIHIPIIGLTLLPAFFHSLPILLLPLHIVFLELIIDPVCSVAFEFEQEEKGIMKRKPREPHKKFFGIRLMYYSILQGILLLGMVVSVYFLSINEGHSVGEVRTIAFTSLVIGNVFLILTDLSNTRSIFEIFKGKNKAAVFILSIALVILVLTISVPYLNKIFSFEFPGYKHFITSITGAFIILIILETNKYFRNKKQLS